MDFMRHNPQYIAVAVICDKNSHVLLSQRHPDSHQGGLWEFPGGKVEIGETVEQALVREIAEELHLAITKARPLIRIPYNYPDKQVLLDVWLVTDYVGEPVGAEGQAIKWVSLDDIASIQMPSANKTIVTACHLPEKYMITPEPGDSDLDWDKYMKRIECSVENGISLIQFRAKSLDRSKFEDLAKEVISVCHKANCKVIINTDILLVDELDADGWHLSSTLLLKQNNRVLSDSKLLGASCHNLDEVRHANMIGCDFVVLSPVMNTLSHPDTPPMGWDNFRKICDESAIPVYALGGMNISHLSEAWQSGAQGISGISTFWQYY